MCDDETHDDDVEPVEDAEDIQDVRVKVITRQSKQVTVK